MLKGTCRMCLDTAGYECACENPPVGICSSHLVQHLGLPAIHKITKCTVSHNNISNEAIKGILNKLAVINQYTAEQIQKIMNTSREVIAQINLQTKEVLQKLLRFRRYCGNLESKVRSKQKILIKEFYTPLEAALIRNDSESIFKNFTYPEVCVGTYKNIITLRDSNLPHIFNNYNDFSLFISDNTDLLVYPPQALANPQFPKDCSCLQVSNTSFLITGGSTRGKNCYLLEFPFKITEYAMLNQARTLHTMAWVNDSPAVIGGQSQKEALNSVEVFQNGKWKTISPLNSARFSASAISINDQVWVFGGCDENSIIDSIEYFENDSWKVCIVKVPNFIYRSFILASTSGIYIYGGVNYKKQYSNKAYLIDLENKAVAECREIKEEVANELECWSFNGKTVSGFNLIGEVVGFQL